MPLPPDRQTLIALKARRTAFRIVTDFLHLTTLDERQGICQRCGNVLPENTGEVLPGLCPQCSARERTAEESARLWKVEPHSTYVRIQNPAVRYVALAVLALMLAAIILMVLAAAGILD